MSILDRINARNQKKNVAVQTPVEQQFTPPAMMEPTSAPIKEAATGTNVQQTKIEQPYITPGTDTRDWRRAANYEDASKINPNLSRSQYISGASQYRRDNNMQPFSDAELFTMLSGKDPFTTPQQEQKNEKRLQTAERVNAIGNVLANLVNYVRTTKGNPAMSLPSMSQNQARIDRLRNYQDALAKSNYNAYMNILSAQRQAEREQDEADRLFQQKIYLENMKQNNPLARAQLKRAEQQIESEKAKRDSILAGTEYSRLRAEGQRLDNAYKPKKQAADLALTYARAENERKSEGKGKKKKSGTGSEEDYPTVRITGGKGTSRSYDLNDDQEVTKLYNVLEKIRNIPEEERPNSIKAMREYILTTMGKYYENSSYTNYADGSQNTSPQSLGWGKQQETNSNNDLDW